MYFMCVHHFQHIMIFFQTSLDFADVGQVYCLNVWITLIRRVVKMREREKKIKQKIVVDSIKRLLGATHKESWIKSSGEMKR